jgi:putative drug exporter of the RND superfamily
MDGAEPADAAGRALATSGQAVLIAAGTVVVALLGLYASGITFIGKLGLAAGLTVAVAALGAVTLVPALLGLAGRRIDRLRVRRHPAAEAQAGPGGWQHYAERVGSAPWLFLIAGTAVLAVLAIPFLPDVASVTPVRATPDGAVLYATVQPSSGPQAEATDQLMNTLQDRVLPGHHVPARPVQLVGA